MDMGQSMGCKRRTFVDYPRLIVCLQLEPKAGKRRDVGDLGRKKHGKIEVLVDEKRPVMCK